MKKEKKEKKAPETTPEEEVQATEAAAEAETETSPEEPEQEAEKEPTAEEKLAQDLAAEKDRHLRLRAEYDNYRKRTSAEKLQIYDDATAHAIKEILHLADSVTQALIQLEGKEVPEEFKKGIELIAQQLKTSLEKLKVEPFGEVGDTFDPALHNAVSMTEDENLGENTIAAVYQKGYKIGDKIIRHAMVVVANA